MTAGGLASLQGSMSSVLPRGCALVPVLGPHLSLGWRRTVIPLFTLTLGGGTVPTPSLEPVLRRGQAGPQQAGLWGTSVPALEQGSPSHLGTRGHCPVCGPVWA